MSDSCAGKIPWRREWLPTPIVLPRKFHGERNLAHYSLWGPRVRHDWACTRARAHTHKHTHIYTKIQAAHVLFSHHLSSTQNSFSRWPELAGYHSEHRSVCLESLTFHCRGMRWQVHLWGQIHTRGLYVQLSVLPWALGWKKPISSVQWLSCVQFFETPWAATCQASWPPPTPGAYLNSYRSSQWCHPTISSSVVPFSSHSSIYNGHLS